MAAAAAVLDNEDNPRRGKLTPQDEQILKEPYAEAVSFMGYRDDLIVYAVKLLKKQQRCIEVGLLLTEVEKLEEREKSGRNLPPLEGKKAPKGQRLGSDGEETDGSEFGDDQIPGRNDIQTDGEQPARQNKVKEAAPLEGAAVQGASVQRKREDGASVQRQQDGASVQGQQEDGAGVQGQQEDGASVQGQQEDGASVQGQQEDGASVQGQQEDRASVQGPEDAAALQRKLKALQHENVLLKARQLCRGCRQRTVSITFLPCGHYSYCYECGQQCSTCPVCKKTVLADVRTFLA